MTENGLMIFGASARAAAFSALRANLKPWCADLFADEDLQTRVPTLRVPFGSYPQAFLELAGEMPGPWMYTGGLENHAWLIHEIARLRPLWGNDKGQLTLARSPLYVASVLAAAGMPGPEVRRADDPPSGGRWIVKPVAGAGGTGIHMWSGGSPGGKGVYFQEYIDGLACAAIYVGDGLQARLLGVTRQLVGETWLHAKPFRYCGSIGPLDLEQATTQGFEDLGNALARGCRLRGIFGVDCILRDGMPWAVEVNPRYTASVEVLEYATGIQALAWHRRVFEPGLPAPKQMPAASSPPVRGKAILFARAPLAMPKEGAWSATLQSVGTPAEMPAFADIPQPGVAIKTARPILTVFAGGSSPAACLEALRQMAQDLDRRLFGK